MLGRDFSSAVYELPRWISKNARIVVPAGTSPEIGCRISVARFGHLLSSRSRIRLAPPRFVKLGQLIIFVTAHVGEKLVTLEKLLVHVIDPDDGLGRHIGRYP